MELMDFDACLIGHLKSVFHRGQHIVERICNDSGITLIQAHVLGMLVEYGELPVTELSQRLNMTKGNLSSMCKRMENQGLVWRRRSQKDERIVYVVATESGLELIKTIEQQRAAFYDFRGDDTPEGLKQEILQAMSAMSQYIQIYEEQYQAFVECKRCCPSK